MHFSTAAILSALAAVPLASGLGINCRGSGYCGGSSSTMRNLLAFAKANVPDNAYFGNGQQIICTNTNQGVSLVAFLFLSLLKCFVSTLGDDFFLDSRF